VLNDENKKKPLKKEKIKQTRANLLNLDQAPKFTTHEILDLGSTKKLKSQTNRIKTIITWKHFKTLLETKHG